MTVSRAALAYLLFVAAAGCLVAGGLLLDPAAGLLTAGVALAAAGWDAARG